MYKPEDAAKIAIEKKNILEPKEFKDKGFRATKEWSKGGSV